MRKVLANIIGLAIVALLVVGFKSYVIYYYEPVENTIHIGSKVNIEYDKSKSNHKLEALSYYLDETYITKDYGETYTKVISQETIQPVETPAEQTETNVEEEPTVKENQTGTITFEVKHDIVENICIEESKLQKIDKYFLMKYSKLNNEIDLVNYYINNKDTDSQVIDFIYQIKTKYLSSIFIKEMNLQNEVKELVGLDGYLVKDKTNTKAVIFNKGNSYEVTFSEEFAEEDIVKILNTFVFE